MVKAFKLRDWFGQDKDAKSTWRGSLLPLGCVAAPKSAIAFYQKVTINGLCDRFAIEREQAPSPQESITVLLR
ncbi:hypothetical protein AO353_25700 [Pseudomonas fluorescens]|uniref:Uncharacterized protein n=1 Tax=Pseudomonas fluorescens TaxID=294 RepID=A0A0N7H0W7_PSEFL|nr:hypothetical protein AO353_25700 [Pseudomonas fluorescens]